MLCRSTSVVRARSSCTARCRSLAVCALSAGDRVRVTAPITVFHVPKTKGAATLLQGKTGTIAAIVDKHTDGAQLSCTMPLKACVRG